MPLNYSRVRNKRSPTLINFLTFFQALRPYSGLRRSYHCSISIRHKWGYAYSFFQIFQGLCLFKGLRLFQTLEYRTGKTSCLDFTKTNIVLPSKFMLVAGHATHRMKFRDKVTRLKITWNSIGVVLACCYICYFSFNEFLPQKMVVKHSQMETS